MAVLTIILLIALGWGYSEVTYRRRMRWLQEERERTIQASLERERDYLLSLEELDRLGVLPPELRKRLQKLRDGAQAPEECPPEGTTIH